MDWQIIVALVIAVPVILLPVAVVWYINGAGVYRAIKIALARRRVVRREPAEAASRVDLA
jgi:hypothetical protein